MEVVHGSQLSLQAVGRGGARRHPRHHSRVPEARLRNVALNFGSVVRPQLFLAPPSSSLGTVIGLVACLVWRDRLLVTGQLAAQAVRLLGFKFDFIWIDWF